MVRRLSFINNFNKTRTSTFTTKRHSHTDACMNIVFYIRKPFVFRFITKHRRKTWRRRKHMFEYVLYLNILSLWATEYVFFRKLIKFNYSYCITKSSLFVYNLAALRTTNPSVAKNSEHTYLATLPKSIINYFLKLNWKTYQFWQQPINTPVIISSFFVNNPTDEIFKTCLISGGFVYSSTTLVAFSNALNDSNLTSYSNLIDIITHQYVYNMIVEVYKLHILLTWLLINK